MPIKWQSGLIVKEMANSKNHFCLTNLHCDIFDNINDSKKDNKFYPKQMQKNSSFYKKMPMKWQSGLFMKADGGVIVNLICRCRHLKVQETALVLISSLVSR